MKTLLAILGGVFLLWLAWYFGFLNFLKAKGANCTLTGGTGKYIYGKCTFTPACDPNNLGFTTDGKRDTKCDPKDSCPETCNQQLGELFDDCGYPCPNVRTVQTRDISAELQIVKNAEAELANARITNAGKVSHINQRLSERGVRDLIVIEKGNPPPSGFRLCECRGGQYQIVNFWQWAFAGGCGGLSIAGSPCFPA